MNTNRLIHLLALGVCMMAVPSTAAAPEGDPDPGDQARRKASSPAEATVVVTASRYEQPLEKAPGAVSVVTSEEIQALAPKFTNDAIALVPGVQVRRIKGMMDIQRTFSIRGFGSANRVLVLVDGQRREDWDRIPASMVERIEVVRGPHSALYGDAAMGGVVNLITKTPTGLMAEMSLGAESYGTSLVNLTYGDRHGSFDWSLSATRRHTDGYASDSVLVTPTTTTGTVTQVQGLQSVGLRRSWSDTTGSWSTKEYFLAGESGKNDMTDHHVGLSFGWNLAPDARLSFQGYTKGYTYGYDTGTSFVLDLNGNRVQPLLGTTRLVQQPDGKRFSLSGNSFEGTYGGEPGRGLNIAYDQALGTSSLLSVKTGGSFADHWYADPSKTNSSTRERRIWAEAQCVTTFSAAHRLTAGLAWKRDRVDCDKWNLSDWKDFDSTTTMNFTMQGEVSTSSAFLQYGWAVTPGLDLTAGLRLDAWRTPEGENTYWNGSASRYVTTNFEARSRNAVSPKLAVVWKAAEHTILRASAGSAFRGPTGTDLYKDWDSSGKLYLGNPDLKPESTRAWEMGIDQGLWKGAKFQLTGFDNRAKDFIYRRTLSAAEVSAYNASHGTTYGASAISRYDNVGDARLKGFETALTQDTGDFRLTGSWTRTLSRVERQDANLRVVGCQLPQVPPNVWNVSVDWRRALSERNSLQVAASTRWMDKTFSTDDNADVENGPQRYEAYALADLHVTWEYRTAGKHVWRLSASVENALDRRYYQYYLAPGRTVGLSLAWRY